MNIQTGSIVNFYDIPECIERDRFHDVVFDIDICDNKGIPYYLKNEICIKKWNDIKLQMYIDKNGQSDYVRKVFLWAPNTGKLYLTNYRLIYIRKPCIKGYDECAKLLEKKSKDWIESKRFESVSIPKNFIAKYSEPLLLKNKYFTLHIKSKIEYTIDIFPSKHEKSFAGELIMDYPE